MRKIFDKNTKNNLDKQSLVKEIAQLSQSDE